MVYTDLNQQIRGPACVTRAFGVPSRRRRSRRYADSILGHREVRGGSEFAERALQTLLRKRPANECEHPTSLDCPRHEVQHVR